jgi:hypothetical protein
VAQVVELDEIVAEPPSGFALEIQRLLELLLGHKVRLDKLLADS